MSFGLDARKDWIVERVKAAGASGVIVGVSGGKDSSVVLALCVEALGAEKVLAVAMPCGSTSSGTHRHLNWPTGKESHWYFQRSFSPWTLCFLLCPLGEDIGQ